MKKITTLFCLVILGLATQVQAQINMRGLFDLGFIYGDSTFSQQSTMDKFFAIERIRLQLECIQSPDLYGVMRFEIGQIDFGKDSTGGALGADRSIVEVTHAYVDWKVPNSDLRLRMGLQPIMLPGRVQTSSPVLIPGASDNSPAVLEVDAAGVSASLPLNEISTLTGFWMRAFNDNTESNYNDHADFFALINANNLGDHKITPWIMYGMIGQNSLNGKSTTAETALAEYGLLPYWASLGAMSGLVKGSSDLGNAYWAGLSYEGIFDRLHICFDANAGYVDFGSFQTGNGSLDLKRSGWYAGLMADYKFDLATPGIVGWYASGDDGDINNGSEMMPYVAPYWRGTPYSYGRNHFTYDGRVGYSPAGTWGLGLYVKDLPLGELFEYTILRAVYLSGTNSPEMPDAAAFHGLPLTPAGIGLRYLTTEDRAVELSLENQFHIYPNLLLYTGLSYIHMELSDDVWGQRTDDHKKDGFEVGFNFRYYF